jgi:hypothetical protein
MYNGKWEDEVTGSRTRPNCLVVERTGREDEQYGVVYASG